MAHIPNIRISFVAEDKENDKQIDAGNDTVTMYAKYKDHEIVVMPDVRGFHCHVQPEGWDDSEVIVITYSPDDGLGVEVNKSNVAKLDVLQPFEDRIRIRPVRLEKHRNRSSGTSRMG